MWFYMAASKWGACLTGINSIPGNHFLEELNTKLPLLQLTLQYLLINQLQLTLILWRKCRRNSDCWGENSHMLTCLSLWIWSRWSDNLLWSWSKWSHWPKWVDLSAVNCSGSSGCPTKYSSKHSHYMTWTAQDSPFYPIVKYASEGNF